MRKLVSLLTALAFGAATFAVPALAQDKGTIGIAMPTKSSARWISDGNSMVKQFEEAGYSDERIDELLAEGAVRAGEDN